MTALTILEMLNYCLVLLFGLLLSVYIAGGYGKNRYQPLLCGLGLIFLLVQGACYFFCGVTLAERLYPLIIHLPLTLVLTFVMKKPFGVSLISVCTAYLCCQLPRWISLLALGVTASPLVGEVVYTLSIVPTFLLLRRHFAPAAYSTMTYSNQTLLIFGSLPLVYYCFDYATTVYSDVFRTEVQAIYEFLPTALIGFYVLFLSLYHVQSRKKAQAELHSTILEAELKQTNTELQHLKTSAHQTAVYHHDMRHHLLLLGSYLDAGKTDEAAAYIRRVQSDVENILPRRFCQHEAVNLLCSSFAEKAQQQDVTLTVEATLPPVLSLPDTELCSVVSNGLENALHATAALPKAQRWVRFFCAVRGGNLLVEIRNPYQGQVTFREGLPVSPHADHGYGCRSIAAIATGHRGHCLFDAAAGIFTLRVVIPIKER